MSATKRHNHPPRATNEVARYPFQGFELKNKCGLESVVQAGL